MKAYTGSDRGASPKLVRQASLNVFVVIPTYNEAENLPAMVAALLEQPIPRLQVLIVDDNSPDGTGEIAEALRQQHGPRIHVMHRSGKQGLGSAYLEGFRYALGENADVVVQMDADFSHAPADIPRFLQHCAEYDVIVGSRYVKGGRLDPTWGKGRHLLSWWANSVYVRLILGLKVQDATGGFKCWSRRALQAVLEHPITSNGYIFQVEMALVAERLGLRTLELPIFFQERRHGSSKMSGAVQLEAMWRTWALRRRYAQMRAQPRVHQADPSRVAVSERVAERT